METSRGGNTVQKKNKWGGFVLTRRSCNIYLSYFFLAVFFFVAFFVPHFLPHAIGHTPLCLLLVDKAGSGLCLFMIE